MQYTMMPRDQRDKHIHFLTGGGAVQYTGMSSMQKKGRVALENQAGQISDASDVWFTRAGSFCSGDGDITANFFRTLLLCFTTSINLEASNQVLRCRCKEKRRQAKGSKMTLFRETALRKSEAYPTRTTENQWSRNVPRVENWSRLLCRGHTQIGDQMLRLFLECYVRVSRENLFLIRTHPCSPVRLNTSVCSRFPPSNPKNG